MRTAPTETIGPPSKALLARELLAWPELGAFAATMPWWALGPRGDGHPVLVLPGLALSDGSTLPMRMFLASQGYRVRGWGQGRNTGRSGLLDEGLVDCVRDLHARDGRKVSLVGWSMGGLFARVLAHEMPGSVRQVVTLGSPFTGPPRASNAWRLYEALSGEKAGDVERMKRSRDAPGVPLTSVYSRRDGIVAWQCCIEDHVAHPRVENVEVASTHCGMGHHPAVLHIVADRLAQAEDDWQPFAPAPPLRWMYPRR